MSVIHVLGESAVRSLALALTVAILLRVLRVHHARLAKRAWTAVLILALAMPALVALHIPSFSFTALWSAPRTVIRPAATVVPVVVDGSSATAPAAAPSADLATADFATEDFATTAPSIRPDVPVPAALQGAPAPTRHLALWQIGFGAYLVITALLLLRVLLGLALAVRLWRRAQPFATSEADLPASIPVRLSVRLSMDLRSPATVGHGILLPLEAIEWDDAALRATLAHEAQHIREGDFFLQLAATLHHCFFWISPHAWWLRPQLSRLSEAICDRAAIASSGDGLSYAQLLLRFATAEQTPAGMLAMAQSAGLRERIDRLIADPQLTSTFRHRRGQGIVAAALLATAAVVAAASVHILQPETIVLAAPQAPAPPPAPVAPQAAPVPLPAPDTAPVLAAPDATSAPVPPVVLAPDAAPMPLIEQQVEPDNSDTTIVRVMPHVRVRAQVDPNVDPEFQGKVVPFPRLDSVTPLGPLATVRPLVMPNIRMKVLAMPQGCRQR
jgi:beta-lactamase regulating signal transducer with metallopeptidase domain